MSDLVNSHSAGPLDGSPILVSGYEPPRLIAIGNLHDLLAGTGSLPCDQGLIATGPDSAIGAPGPGECGSAG
jgi:hypothetical protein